MHSSDECKQQEDKKVWTWPTLWMEKGQAFFSYFP